MTALFDFERPAELSEADPMQPPAPGPTVNAELLNAILRRQVVVARAAEEVARRIGEIYAEAATELVAKIRAAYARGFTGENFSQALRGRLLGELQSTIRAIGPLIGREFDSVLREIAAAELETGVRIFGHAIPEGVLSHFSVVRPPAFLLDVSNLEVLGQSLGRWYALSEATVLNELARQVSLGALQGDDMAAMIRRVSGLFDVYGTRAMHVGRTAVQTVSNEANDRLYRSNSDVIKSVEWTATFDRRTCPVCASLDGHKYPVESSHPRPPAHPSCRCVMVPITKSWKELAAETKAAKLRELPLGTRASMDGQVAGSMTFADWLRTQPRSVAEDILGAGRADLFLSGQARLGDFVNHARLRPIPVSTVRDALARATTGQ